MCANDSSLPFARKMDEAWVSCTTADGVAGAKLYVQFARQDIPCELETPMDRPPASMMASVE